MAQLYHATACDTDLFYSSIGSSGRFCWWFLTRVSGHLAGGCPGSGWAALFFGRSCVAESNAMHVSFHCLKFENTFTDFDRSHLTRWTQWPGRMDQLAFEQKKLSWLFLVAHGCAVQIFRGVFVVLDSCDLAERPLARRLRKKKLFACSSIVLAPVSPVPRPRAMAPLNIQNQKCAALFNDAANHSVLQFFNILST